MPSVSAPRLILILAPLCVFAACGGDGSGRDVVVDTPQDTMIRPLEHQPLTDADLTGLDLTDVALHFPWSTNTVTHGAPPGAPPIDVRSAVVTGHDAFDRVLFALGEDRPVSGYEVKLVGAGASVPCGDGTRELTAPRSLVVVFSAARAGAGGESWIPAGLSGTSAPRMARAGVLCDGSGTVTWVAEVGQGEEIRLLELRNPSRVAVDVR